MKKVDQFYSQKEEPVKSCLLALRSIILNFHDQMSETVKYGMPCYCLNGKVFCYLWTDKKTNEPYILMVEGNKIDHSQLVKGDRSRMKILPLNSRQDLPLETIHEIFHQAIKFYI